MPRAHRVRTTADFQHIRRTGVRAGRRHVVVTVAAGPDPTRPAPSSTSPGPRAGFVVSKAVGDAVTRNRVKRRLRAIVAEQLRGAELAGTDALVQVRALPAAAGVDHAQLRRDVVSALRQCLRKIDGRRPRTQG
nr:ribonuclease P protein component [Micrococcus cohnii]